MYKGEWGACGAALRAGGLGNQRGFSGWPLLATEPKPGRWAFSLPATLSSGGLLGRRGRRLRVSLVFFHNIFLILKKNPPQLHILLRKRRQELFAKASVCGQATQCASETSCGPALARGLAELLGQRRGSCLLGPSPLSLSAT